MPHALSRSPATQRPRRFLRSRTALLAALVAGGLTSLPAWSSQSVAGAPLIAQAAQEGGTGGRAAIQIERSRPRPGLPRSERTDLPRVALTEDIMYRVLASEVSLQRGLVEPAYRTYLGLAQDTRDPRFAQRATEIAFLTRSPRKRWPPRACG